MQPRDPSVWLLDLAEAGDRIVLWTTDLSVSQYSADSIRKSAVERQFEILAEALKRVLALEPGLSLRFHQARGVIDLRNIITHGYYLIDDATILSIANKDVPPLVQTARDLLAERSPPP